MTKEEKKVAIEELKDALGGIKNLYLADIAGLNATQTSNLRKACFNENIKLQVVKNSSYNFFYNLDGGSFLSSSNLCLSLNRRKKKQEL